MTPRGKQSQRAQIQAAAERVERLAPLDPRYREAAPGNRFFTLCAVAEETGLLVNAIADELVKRHERMSSTPVAAPDEAPQ